MVFFDRRGRSLVKLWDSFYFALADGRVVAILDGERVRSISGNVKGYYSQGLVLDERGFVLLWSEGARTILDFPPVVPGRQFLPVLKNRAAEDLLNSPRGPIVDCPKLQEAWSMVSPRRLFSI